LLVFRSQEQKSDFILGRFSSSFAEITDVKIMEPGFRWLRNRIPKDNLHPAAEKIKPHSDYFSSDEFSRVERIDSKKTINSE